MYEHSCFGHEDPDIICDFHAFYVHITPLPCLIYMTANASAAAAPPTANRGFPVTIAIPPVLLEDVAELDAAVTVVVVFDPEAGVELAFAVSDV